MNGKIERGRKRSGGAELGAFQSNERTWKLESGTNRSGLVRRVRICIPCPKRLRIARGGGETSWRGHKMGVQRVPEHPAHLPACVWAHSKALIEGF